MRNNLLYLVNEIIDGELDWSMMEHGEFHSRHEGYAILLEELDELGEALYFLKAEIDLIWKDIKSNDPSLELKRGCNSALLLAVEAIQVAAMVKKFESVKDEL